MFSFRYHLVTIFSIFAALALGLLLGAAIAASDLARSTSDDMVGSMLSRYETLVDDKSRLEQELENDSALAEELVGYWSDERLSGRTVAVLLGDTLEDRGLFTDISRAVTQASGSVVEITVLRTDFGLDDEDIRAALQEVVEEVPGEEYQTTIANRLLEEWSYVFTSTSIEPTQEDMNLPRHSYSDVSVANVIGDVSTSSGIAGESVTESSVADSDLTPQTAFQRAFYERYALTRTLLASKVIRIEADYSYLEEHEDPSAPSDQLAAYHVATAWQLPYGVTGLVNGLAQQQDDAMMQTRIGLRLTLGFQEAGAKGDLTYPTWLTTSIPRSTSGDVALPNYYSLLIQPSHLNYSMDILASENSLSCVTKPETLGGRYSIVALLSGAQAGIYGADRPVENRFAPLPEDISGRAVFRQ